MTHLPGLALRRHFHLQVLRAPFYRNKAAYIVGRAINGADVIPFVIPVLNNEHGAVYVDTLLMEVDDIANLFSFARAYFMVETDTPAAVVHFLQRMLPTKIKRICIRRLACRSRARPSSIAIFCTTCRIPPTSSRSRLGSRAW